MKKVLFSGIKPSGDIHVGNYLGALRNWVSLQSHYSCLYSIVDYHALTSEIAPRDLATNTRRLAVDLLAIGIDPRKSILFKQSDVPEHTELAWLFSTLVPVAELLRMTQYKDKSSGQTKPNTGLLTYPILQAADILLYRAEAVPVGEDQLQHLELSRVIARKFNSRYGKFFPEVQPVLSEMIRVMSLTDPKKKMSKSHGPKSYIALRDTPAEIEKKLAKAVTDSLEAATTLSGGHNLLILYKAFAKKSDYEKMNRAHQLKELSYADLKMKLSYSISKAFAPIHKKIAALEKKQSFVDSVLRDGAKRASVIAKKNMKDIRSLVGLS